MRKLAFSLTICAAATFLVAMHVAPAQAQVQHIWIASYGVDNSACGSRAAPCRGLQEAVNKISPGGEITCVDSGDFVGAEITKSLTVNCANVIGSIGGLSIITAVTDAVILRGLDLNSTRGAGSPGMIEFHGAGVLHLEKMKINNYGLNALLFAPSGPALLDVSDSTINDNGSPLDSAGILIRPVSGGSANVTIDRVRFLNNVNGIFLDNTHGGGAVNLSVRDSVVTGSANCGIVVATNGPALTALVDGTTVTSSRNAGIAVSGAAASVRIGNSTISGNVTGVLAVNGGNLRSYKNNQINSNLTDGTPIAAADALN